MYIYAIRVSWQGDLKLQERESFSEVSLRINNLTLCIDFLWVKLWWIPLITVLFPLALHTDLKSLV